MGVYRIYRMKESPRQQFRWAPHVAGCAPVKRKDYDEGGQVEAASEYSAWKQLQDCDARLAVGDLLESETGELFVFKYIGFEPAQWWAPPPPPLLSEQQVEAAPQG